MAHKVSFHERANHAEDNPLKSYLLHLIAAKKSNLCVSADVNSTGSLLRLAEDVGDHICVLKTHADIIDDFGERTIKGLKEISRRKRFLIFEDRKFGDIGSTVQAQYTRGPLAIATWAHIVNAHIFPGPAIVPALRSAADQTLQTINRSVTTEIFVGTPRGSTDGEEETFDFLEKADRTPLENEPSRKGSVVATTLIYQSIETSATPGTPRSEFRDFLSALHDLGDPPCARGLLLFAQMSSEGNLMDEAYTRKCVQIARENNDFVLGYISQRNLNERRDNFISFTPGVKLPAQGDNTGKKPAGDGLGQQYRTPEMVVLKDGCDIVIVGRGIITAKDRAAEAKRYKEAAWRAYEMRIRV